MSINDQLAGKTQTSQEIQDQARKISKELNKNAQKIGETIKEKAPAWKQGIKNALDVFGNSVDSIIEKLQSIKQ